MPDLDQSIASNQGRADEGMPSAGFTFVAPASEELGGEITIAVLVNGIGQGGDASKALAAEAIRQSFLSVPTGDPFQAISDAFKRANDAILARRSSQVDPHPTGCSATIALVAGDRVFVGNLGDNRVYFIRETEIETLAADHSWVHEARQSWRFKPGEIQDHDDAIIPHQYLGKEEGIAPLFAPIEFLWPGDALMLCTAGLVSRLRDNDMYGIIAEGDPAEASRKLVQAAIDRGAQGNLTNVILQMPRAANTYDSIPVPGRRGFGLSPAGIALILANLFLVCIIAAVMLGGPAFVSSIRSVEVAQPAFQVTDTATATPTPGLDVGTANQTPTVPSSAPAAAPTALSGNTPTPPGIPTYTPQPSPPNWVAPPPPPLIVPVDGFVFNGPDAEVVLEWRSVGAIPEDVFYVVSIKKWVDGKYVGESRNWTKSNRIRLDSSFYTALGDGPRRFANAAPLLAAGVDQFEWSVAIYRLTLIKPDGTLEGVAVSQPSFSRRFTWGPALPTRVYGG